jgi:hypothetical protein
MPDPRSASETSTTVANGSIGTWFQRHREKLWWLHSGYALLLGIGIMWLGARNHNYLRVTVFHLGFIWLSSLFLPKLLSQPRWSERWAHRLRLFVNYFNKNFYQQVLFFILPIYYASATLSSANVFFVLVLATSAILSTFDVVYDRHLSVRRSLTGLFFAFNLFALINVMLPVLWGVSNTWTTRIGAVLAALGFVTLYNPFPHRKWLRLAFGAVTAILFVLFVETGRAYIPPAPLRLVDAEFGSGFDRQTMQVAPALRELEPGQGLSLWGLTAIRAPLGLREKVQHRWYRNGKLFWTSPFYEVTGGREEGFRLWTRFDFAMIEASAVVRVDVETEGGQLIGRAEIKAAKAALRRNSSDDNPSN